MREEVEPWNSSRGEISMKVAVALAISQRLRVLVRRAAEDHAARVQGVGSASGRSGGREQEERE